MYQGCRHFGAKAVIFPVVLTKLKPRRGPSKNSALLGWITLGHFVKATLLSISASNLSV